MRQRGWLRMMVGWGHAGQGRRGRGGRAWGVGGGVGGGVDWGRLLALVGIEGRSVVGVLVHIVFSFDIVISSTVLHLHRTVVLARWVKYILSVVRHPEAVVCPTEALYVGHGLHLVVGWGGTPVLRGGIWSLVWPFWRLQTQFHSELVTKISKEQQRHTFVVLPLHQKFKCISCFEFWRAIAFSFL